MAKKRKAPGAPRSAVTSKENGDERVRLNVNSYEDVAGSDDEFHINRDQILLDEGPEAKRRRKWQEQGLCTMLSSLA